LVFGNQEKIQNMSLCTDFILVHNLTIYLLSLQHQQFDSAAAGLTLNFADFLRHLLRQLLTDEAATYFTWTGAKGNYQVKSYKTIECVLGRRKIFSQLVK
jgi:hypothetical protein